MKKWIFSCLLPLLLTFSATAADMQNAETLYREGRFAAALGEYEELLQTYPNDPHLYYNIGNCYFKMGSRGLAIANYYRAFRLSPRDTDIRHNLSLALTESGERFVPEGMPEALHKAFFWLQTDELKSLVSLIWCLFCLLAAVWLLKRKLGYPTVVVLFLLIITGIWYAWRLRLDKEELAVVAAPIAELRSGPGNNFPASANVAQGHLVILQDGRDNWKEVVVKSQGIKGWTEANVLEKI